MDAERRENLIKVVKKDDAKGFGALVDADLFSARFGRFPLLSLLYLYDAKRIVKRYLSELVKERPRVKEEPYREAEERFRAVAGKTLRHFVGREVSPLEMLAVLGRGRELKRLYPKYPNAPRFVPAIHRIYFTRLGQGVTLIGNKLSLPAEPYTFAEKRRRMRFAWICLAIGVTFATVTACLSFFFGLGTAAHPDKAQSDGIFLTYVSRGKSLELGRDITLADTITSYEEKILGAGHTIRLKTPFAESFGGELQDVTLVVEEGFEGESVILSQSGNLTNVTFVLPADFKGKSVISVNSGTIANCSFRFASSFAGDAAILTNNGTIQSSTVIAEELTTTRGSDYFALLTARNAGTIESCTATFSVAISGEEYELAEGESKYCYFAPFAGRNEGKVLYCTSKGSVTAKNADVAGLVAENAISGEITGCDAEVTLFQESDVKGWSPNVAGVACKNEGTIGGCVVKGSVTAKESAPELAEGDGFPCALAAGVACENLGTISNCDLSVTVKAESLRGIALSGGVVNQNDYDDEDYSIYGKVEFCTVAGSVEASASEYYAYAGGIIAVNGGCLVRESISTASVVANGASFSFAGGIAAKNGYVELPLPNGYFRQQVGGTLSRCLGKGSVTAYSSQKNCAAGGVAGWNDNNAVIFECGGFGVVGAVSEGNLYDFTGGVVGQNGGNVQSCFFAGALVEADEDSLVGAIAGLSALRSSFGLYTDLRNDYYVQGVAAHACGALQGDNIYTEEALARSNESYVTLLDYGSVALESLEALKATEVYYE